MSASTCSVDYQPQTIDEAIASLPPNERAQLGQTAGDQLQAGDELETPMARQDAVEAIAERGKQIHRQGVDPMRP